MLVFPHSILVSAHTGLGIDSLLQRIDDFLPDPSVEVMLVIPYSRGDLLAKVHQDGKVLMTEHNDDGTQVHAFVPSELAHQLKQIYQNHLFHNKNFYDNHNKSKTYIPHLFCN